MLEIILRISGNKYMVETNSVDPNIALEKGKDMLLEKIGELPGEPTDISITIIDPDKRDEILEYWKPDLDC